MANRYASGKYAKAICDRCGFEYPLLELTFESVAAKGSPTSQLAELRVCWRCHDKVNPQAFLTEAARAKLPDAQQLWKPRPDIFPVAYPVNYKLPNAVYSNNYPALSIPIGFSGPLIATGVFAGYSATIPSPPAGINVYGITFVDPMNIMFNLTAAGPAGQVEMYIVDGGGNSLGGLINVTE